MLPIDETQARQVWSRVMAASPAAPAHTPSALPDANRAAPKSSTPESAAPLSALYADACQTASDLRALAAKAPPWAKKTLCQLSAHESTHAKQLAALYYMEAGTMPYPCRSSAGRLPQFQPELRRVHCRVCAAEYRYASLSKNSTYLHSSFAALADGAAQTAATLRCILQRSL